MRSTERTGEEVWRAIDVVTEMGYAQPVIYEAGGVRQLIVWHPTGVASLNPETGETWWEEAWEARSAITVATPVAATTTCSSHSSTAVP